MKSFIIALSLLMVSSVLVFAETTTSANWTTASPGLNSLLNQYATHTHEVKDVRGTMGLGVDCIVWEFTDFLQSWGADTLEVQSRWDLNNGGRYELYGVMKVNLVRPVKALFGLE